MKSIKTMSHEERINLFRARKKRNSIISIINLFAVAFVVVAIAISLLCIESFIKNTRSMDAMVIYTNDNEVAVVTIDCNEWSFEGKGFEEGELVRVTFNTMGTDNVIEDDEITSVKKINKKVEKEG